MKTNKNSQVVSTKTSSSLNKSMVENLVKNGIIKEDYIQIKQGFNGIFDVIDVIEGEMTSYKSKEKVSVPKLTFSNDNTRFVVWGTTLLNSLVLKDYIIKTKPIEKANGLPVWFSDEFHVEFPNVRKVSDLRDENGGIPLYNKYKIVGAIVHRSRVDSSRWDISPRLYEMGSKFIEFEMIRTKNINLTWISEERLITISKLSEIERTFTDSNNEVVVLPKFEDLRVIGNADNDVRWARAQFIIEQTWE